MKLWLDDARPLPAGFDLHAKTADEAIAFLEGGGITLASLDHDLGSYSLCGSGRDVSLWIMQAAYTGRLAKCLLQVHSANHVEGMRMLEDLRNAYLHWGVQRPVYWVNGDTFNPATLTWD